MATADACNRRGDHEGQNVGKDSSGQEQDEKCDSTTGGNGSSRERADAISSPWELPREFRLGPSLCSGSAFRLRRPPWMAAARMVSNYLGEGDSEESYFRGFDATAVLDEFRRRKRFVKHGASQGVKVLRQFGAAGIAGHEQHPFGQ